jgi:hypothetical protein
MTFLLCRPKWVRENGLQGDARVTTTGGLCMFKPIVFAASLFFLSITVGYAATVNVWHDADGVRPSSNVCPPGEDCTVKLVRSSGGKKGKSSKTPPSSTQVTLFWDSVTAANLVGYRIYHGTSATTLSPPYGSGLDVGNVTSYTVTGLESGKRYYFHATAYDSMGNESILSNQVFKDIP